MTESKEAVPEEAQTEASPTTMIEVGDVTKKFSVNKSERTILDHVSLEVEDGEFVSILGHSGCGKSTLLRIVAGLEGSDGGSVLVDGRVVKEPGLDRGMVFQNHMLLPWLTVKQNLEFGYYESDKKRREDKLAEQISLVGLEGYEDAYPRQLSGGMSQRASIARALLHNPKVLLLDEPFGALDAITRMQMQKEVLRIWREEYTTMVLVTHDIDEAVYLSDRIVILDGRPASVKDIIPIELGRPRDWGSIDFARARKRVYDSFFGKTQPTVEYVI